MGRTEKGAVAMNIPKTLKVAGKTYAVEFPYEFVECDDLAGQSDHVTLVIRVSGDKKRDNAPRAREFLEDTFLHELLHCVDQAYNDGESSERTITQLATGLYQVFKDNDVF